jgi:hypothetical protein
MHIRIGFGDAIKAVGVVMVMVKGKGKGAVRQEARLKEKAWPIVTSDVCEKCPIECPAGVAYMKIMKSGNKIGRGVTCKKELFLRRRAEGRPLFFDIPRLARKKTIAEPPEISV